MASVRIATNSGHVETMAWAGAPVIDRTDHIERTIAIPEEAYQRIEGAIVKGHIEGDVYIEDGSRFHWFLDR